MGAVNVIQDRRRVIVALDFDSEPAARRIVDAVAPSNCRLKVGKELFTRTGPAFVEYLVDLGFDVFLDLKFHDIPHTVERACRAAAELGVWMVNVHTLGGRRMLEAAVDGIKGSVHAPILIGVTILTSMDEQDLAEVGLPGKPIDYVLRLTQLASDTGLDGVVCSAREAMELRQLISNDFYLITPGIRLQGDRADDQRRIMTPAAAIGSGSDFLVIGRPVTAAPDPGRALEKINIEIQNALGDATGID